MNKIGTQSLNEQYTSISEAFSRRSKHFPITHAQVEFKEQIKTFLQARFGDDIKLFLDDETTVVIYASYKKIQIGINVFDGIVLMVGDANADEVIKDLKPVFSEIAGSEPVCLYGHHPKGTRIATVYPILVWNMFPEEKLDQLAHQIADPLDDSITGIDDYYTTAIITSLGDNLLTLEGYNALFGDPRRGSVLNEYTLNQIKKARPDIPANKIMEWFRQNKAKVLCIKK
jgi:hypothetical protein